VKDFKDIVETTNAPNTPLKEAIIEMGSKPCYKFLKDLDAIFNERVDERIKKYAEKNKIEVKDVPADMIEKARKAESGEMDGKENDEANKLKKKELLITPTELFRRFQNFCEQNGIHSKANVAHLGFEAECCFKKGGIIAGRYKYYDISKIDVEVIKQKSLEEQKAQMEDFFGDDDEFSNLMKSAESEMKLIPKLAKYEIRDVNSRVANDSDDDCETKKAPKKKVEKKSKIEKKIPEADSDDDVPKKAPKKKVEKKKAPEKRLHQISDDDDDDGSDED
jgi:hypothetical protein